MMKAWKYLTADEKLERLAQVVFNQELRLREIYTSRKHAGYQVIEVETSMLSDDIMLNAYSGKLVDNIN